MKRRVQLIDPRFRHRIRPYLLQSFIATGVLFGVLSFQDAASRIAIIAAIGSTTFILFIMPNSTTASPRHVLGGHTLAVVICGAIAAFNGSGLGQRLVDTSVVFHLEAAIGVGLCILAMAATDTEHAPAAGTALGILFQAFSWGLVFFVLTSVAVLSLAHRLTRPWLRDLL